jgi:hypothetical protein
MKIMELPYRLCRWTLGGLFVYAGVSKLLAPKTFAYLIAAFGIVPEGLLIPVAIGLPVMEVVAGVGLLFDIRGSLGLITGLLVIFMLVLGYAIGLGLDVDCGCFGPEDPEAEAFHGLRLSLLRDLAMLAVVIFIYGWRRYRAIRPTRARVIINQLFNRGRKNAYV